MPGTKEINSGSDRAKRHAYNHGKSKRSRARNCKGCFWSRWQQKSLATVAMMVLLPDESAPKCIGISAGSGAIGLLLSRDLIFTSKIKGTAAELGYLMMVAGTDLQAHSMIETYRPSVVLVDLNAGDLVAPAALISYQKLAGPDTWFVAFGSHVDAEGLRAARDAGCHIVLARSRFAAELPALLRRFFSEAATVRSRRPVRERVAALLNCCSFV